MRTLLKVLVAMCGLPDRLLQQKQRWYFSERSCDRISAWRGETAPDDR